MAAALTSRPTAPPKQDSNNRQPRATRLSMSAGARPLNTAPPCQSIVLIAAVPIMVPHRQAHHTFFPHLAEDFPPP
ncbi:hypothetical protein CUR21_02470 [Pseudorhodobacter sp. MZDSW-24AT]|nr:hypothetical protein CUR21_02470 [Pseudorhodobacter sp. MZDSW-24AT]